MSLYELQAFFVPALVPQAGFEAAEISFETLSMASLIETLSESDGGAFEFRRCGTGEINSAQ